MGHASTILMDLQGKSDHREVEYHDKNKSSVEKMCYTFHIQKKKSVYIRK
jgi:hypothetical protein